MTSAYFNTEVAKMNCAKVRTELQKMAAELDDNKGKDTAGDNYIADLRARSIELGCEMSIEWDAKQGKNVVSP